MCKKLAGTLLINSKNMSNYSLFGRMGEYGYSGSIGEAKKADIYNLGGDRFGQQIIVGRNTLQPSANDFSTSYITHAGALSRLQRDFNQDSTNSREEMQKDPYSTQLAGVPDLLNPPQLDISTPMDYAAHNQINLVQDSIINHQRESERFINPNTFGKDTKEQERGKGFNGMPEEDFYGLEGSAAGMISNRLDYMASRIDEDGQRLNSIESTVAF